MEFHETKGGHEFFYGTMPKLARAVEQLAKAMECYNAHFPQPKAEKMTYEDFYDIAVYGNTNWKGSYTQKEIACYANDYYEDYKTSLLQGRLTYSLQELCENLYADNDEDATAWADSIKEAEA